jgi:glucose-6-phosphate 1-dehydrogenase
MLGVKSVSVSARQSRANGEEPFVLVIFGASGDLAHRKLIPSVYGLHCEGLLPKKHFVVGFARSGMTDDAFRDGLRESVKRYSRVPLDEQKWREFASRIVYLRGEYDKEDDFIRLGGLLADLTAKEAMPANCLFYLATPPDQFAQVAEQLGKAGLGGRNSSGAAARGWRRIVTEKPFGRDLASAEALNLALRRVFDEKNIFRIDHYLGKETVQNLMVLRFANSIFEPIWNQKYIDHVQITVSETLGVERRGAYFDRSGAMRDMLQNHMMNLLCLVAMEPPATLAADAIRNEKVKVLQALRPIPPDCVGFGVVRAQYAAGQVDGRPVAGYLQEPGVASDSLTETFVALKLDVDNWRWAGVPFYLRTGKRLAKRVTEIVIQFKSVPQVLFNAPPAAPLQPNLLVVRIQPDEGVSLQFQVKQPGAATRIHPYTMDFTYAGVFGSAAPDAYERLLLDAATGESTLFIRSDEIEAAWRFVTPVLKGCDREPGKRLPQYAPGSWGPAEADRLVASAGHRWHEPREVPPPPGNADMKGSGHESGDD